ncbi:aminomethyl-transferring glycine dehydrogenase, partial [Ruminococcaceae bacterium OttesenSCG-928-I18]|nr:aminomethyl-transferring glycine dehydrogenase [Ruminococcaceae bacterium OttesenSCG-928-I18]
GPQGMEEVGTTILQRNQYAQKKIAGIPGVKLQFNSPCFKEFVVNFDGTGKTVAEINKKLLDNKIFGGKDLSAEFPEFGQSAQFCVTEVHTKDDIDKLVSNLVAAVS